MGKIYQNQSQILLRELIEIYHPDSYDWLSYQITKQNFLTLHHIIKRANGGSFDLDNLSLLTKKAHRALHICENKVLGLYLEINAFFQEIVALKTALDSYYKEESKEYKKALTRVLYKHSDR